MGHTQMCIYIYMDEMVGMHMAKYMDKMYQNTPQFSEINISMCILSTNWRNYMAKRMRENIWMLEITKGE